MIVSNEPTQYPLVNMYHDSSYFAVVGLTIVVYDFALTFAKELELIWMKQWSLMTVLYLLVRYIGIPYNVIYIINTFPSISVTDVLITTLSLRGTSLNMAMLWSNSVINMMLEIIMITRLYAMYQRSRNMLICLIVAFIAVTVTCTVLASVATSRSSWEEYVVFGNHQCHETKRGSRHMLSFNWVVSMIWETLILSLAVWSAIKHFRNRRGHWTIQDCFVVLVKTQIFYFVSFLIVSSLNLGMRMKTLNQLTSTTGEIGSFFISALQSVQLFVLGPRLVLSVRAHMSKDVYAVEEVISMTPIAFQEDTEKRTGDGGV